MKTAEETLIEHTSNGWFREGSIAAMQAYAEQAVKLALEKAAEKARCSTESCSDGFETWETYGVDKNSILSITPASIINEIENTVKE